MAKQTGTVYREKNRIRLQRYYERQAASGKRRISALLSGNVYNLIINEKNKTGASISDIVEAAVISKFQTRKPKSKTSKKKLPPTRKNIIVETFQTTTNSSISSQMDLFNQDFSNLIPDFTNQIMDTDERDKILLKVAEALPGRHNSKTRLNLLNQKGVPVNTRPSQYGGKWDQKKFTDNIWLARKRLKAKGQS